MDFFTSDWHLNDELIREVCKRPFKTAKRMSEVYIKQANQCAKAKTDNIIHVGDFIQRGLDRGTGVREDQISANDALKQLNANVILLEGNHDGNNRCNALGKVLIRKVGSIDCIVQHYPSNIGNTFRIDGGKYTTVNICGHVHGKWTFFYDKAANALNVNVGIDIYPYMVKECDLAELIKKEAQRLNLKLYRFIF